MHYPGSVPYQDNLISTRWPKCSRPTLTYTSVRWTHHLNYNQFLFLPQTSLLSAMSRLVLRARLFHISFRRIVFNSLHSSSHAGIRATQRLITSRFVWPKINSDVRSWTWNCIQCQRSKIHQHTITPLSTFMPPGTRFDHIHIDLVGPLPPSRGHSYLLTMVDRFTHWPEVHVAPLVDMTADSVAKVFTATWFPGSVFPPQLQRTKDVNSSPTCGLTSCNYWESIAFVQLHTILEQTALLKDSIVNWRLPYMRI